MRQEHLNGRRYIKLVRCSSNEQADTSTDDQNKVLDDFAAAMGMIHAGVEDIVLDGMTGSVPAIRKDIQTVIDLKEAGDAFDVLLVQDLSRLTRGGITHGNKVIWDLAEADIEVVLATGAATGDPDQDALVQSVGFYAAQQQVKAQSFAVVRGKMSALEAGVIPHTCRIPYGVDRLYLGPDGAKRHRIRNLPDGRQQKLHADDEVVETTFGKNPKKGASLHYHRQSDERIVLVPGAPKEVEVVRQIFRRKLIDGWGAYKITKELNGQGSAAPTGGSWGTDTVTKIWRNPTYTGVGIAGRYAVGQYHVRGAKATPEVVRRDARTIARRKKSQVRLRPKQDWKWQPHPMLADYLGEELRELAIAMHAKEFERQHLKATAPLTRPKADRDKHGESPFLLKGLLHSKQGNHPMSGRISGPPHDKRRYYAVRRGTSAPGGGSILAKMIPAETLERAILDVIKDVLLDADGLRKRIQSAVEQAALGRDRDRHDSGALVVERDDIADKLRDALMLGPASRKLMQKQFDQWESRLAALEERIDKVEQADAPPADVGATVEALVKKFKVVVQSLDKLPPPAVRTVLGTLVTRLEVDMETRAVELDLAVPRTITPVDKGSNGVEKPLCLVAGRSWPWPHQAQWAGGLKMAVVHCEGRRGDRRTPPCYTCGRKAA